MDDRGAIHEAGITFNFLLRGNDPTDARISPYLPSAHSAGISLAYGFLEAHGFTTNAPELRPRIADLAELCIELAQGSEG
jgi:hypothetical protein